MEKVGIQFALNRGDICVLERYQSFWTQTSETDFII